MSRYLRLKVLDGKIIGLPEEITEQDAMKVLKEIWNNPNKWLDKGNRLRVDEYIYWKDI